MNPGLYWLSIFMYMTVLNGLSWSITVRERKAGDNGSEREKLEILSWALFLVSFPMYFVIFGMSIPLHRANGFMTYSAMQIRLFEVLVQKELDGDQSFGERMLHVWAPPLDVRNRVKLKNGWKLKHWLQILDDFVLYLGWLMIAIIGHKSGLVPKYKYVCAIVFISQAMATIAFHGLFVRSIFLLFDNSLIPNFMQKPFLSTSIREFWGRRWNRPIHLTLKRQIYVPFRHKLGLSRNVSTMAAFLGSGLFHVLYLGVGGATISEMLGVMLFFIIQAVFMKVEEFYSFHHLGTILGLFIFAPMFTNPHLKIM